MPREKWRPIQGHDGYEVSDCGRIRSIDRVLAVMRRGRAVPAQYRGRVLKATPTSSGYLTIKLGGRGQYVHRLVLEAFVGTCPAGRQAAHLDGDRRNNAAANLAW